MINKLLNIINKEAEHLGKKIEPSKNKDWEGLNINSDFGFGSLKTVELFIACETAFGINFTDEEIFKTKTFGDLINKIEEKLEKK